MILVLCCTHIDVKDNNIAAIASAASSRIIGGTSIDISLVPYQVGLSVGGDFKCGGVIVSTTAVITSAQCVKGVTVSTITVRAGSSFRSTLGTVHTVSSLVIHPSFSSTTYDYDIAILRFSTAFTLGTTVGVATLPSVGETLAAGSVANVTGWGLSAVGGTSFSGNLQVTQVPIVATSVCTAALSRINTITDRMLCAGYTTGGHDVCTGDTGGPLTYGGKVVGLVSWGASCGAIGSPAVYAKISTLRAWISTEAGV
ncbi:trypsin-1-like [Neodiprion fabricii]|uniref:trypsin-1-like n=1 Tax=Neodiprion fabricii TaxID=2872261 RepID=UPI001ED92D56|nr:trypsin-1-like [Neodiprion fabricii]